MHRTIFLGICLALSLGASALHAQPSKGYDVTYYNATVRLDRIQDSIWGNVTMQATVDSSIASILQMVKYMVLDSVFVNGVRASVSLPDTNGEYHVEGFGSLATGSQFSLTTYYHGHGRSEGGTFPWGGVTDSEGMMFSMGVGFSTPYVSCTRHWLPCYDLPDDKADSIDLTFIAPDSDVVASNGLLVNTSSLGNHQLLFHWHESHPIASYLMMFAVGPFIEQSIPNTAGIPFIIYSLAKDTAAMRTEMVNYDVEALQFFDSLYGMYHFEKVGYVLTVFGSMEHQTMICLDPNVLNASSTIPQHELSHHWWGDWVTCSTFNDPWLNEGFAHFSESLVDERFKGENSYWTVQHTNISTAISQGCGALYGAPYHTSPRNNYPILIYDKGAAVLGMLRYYLGDSLFFASLRNYGKAHAFSVASSYDLWNSFNASTGQDLGWFFREWVFRGGYPLVRASWYKTGNTVSIAYTQTQDSATQGYFRVPMLVEGILNGKTERVPVWLDSTHVTNVVAQFSFSPDSIKTDPDGALILRVLSSTETQSVEPSKQSPFPVKVSLLENPVHSGKLSFTITASKPIGNAELWISNEKGAHIATFFHGVISDTKFSINKSIDSLASGSYFAVFQNEKGAFNVTKFTIER